MTYHELQQGWYYYLSIEHDLNETSRYLEPNGQEEVYSFEFYKIIMLCCSEIETTFKQLCKTIDPSSNCGNIGMYKSTILSKFPKIGEAMVFVPRWNGKNLYPFKDWSTGKLEWWDGYTSLKHSRFESIKEASYKNAVNSLAALSILLQYLYKTCGYDCKCDESNYFDSDYYPHATPYSPPTRRVPSRGTPRVPAPLPLSPLSPPDRDRRGDSPAWSGRGSRPSRRTSG